MKKLTVGILGPGTVGGGAYDILTRNHDLIQKRTGISIEVVKLLTRRPRPEFPAELLTDDPDDILTSPDVDVVVETMGGIQPATSFMLQAMKYGKHVVTANKAAVAAAYKELVKTAADNGVKFLFEASVGGGIPIIRPMKRCLAANDIEEIISDLQIETELKEKIDAILFSDLDVKKKRIEIRKLGNKGLEKKFVKLFLNLLEYVSRV